MVRLLVIVFVFSGCAKNEKEKDLSPAGLFFEGRAPSLSGELSAIRWGMTKSEFANLPLSKWADGATHASKAKLKVKFSPRGTLYRVELMLDDENKLRRVLEKRWGTALTRTEAGSIRHFFWANTDERIAASLRHYKGSAATRVVLRRYTPIEELMGGEGSRFGVEKVPLLGAAQKDLAAAYGAANVERDGEFDFIYMPATLRDSRAERTIGLYLDADDRVRGFSITVSTAPEQVNSIIARLEKKLGEAAIDGNNFDFPTSPPVHVRVNRTVGVVHIFVGNTDD